MKVHGKSMLVACAGILLPLLTLAQTGMADDIKGLQGTLNTIYDTMMQQCGELIGISMGIAGFGALCYINARVWRHLARHEPIDVYPLLRPFALGLCIINFSTVVIPVIRGVMEPTVQGTANLVKATDATVAALLKKKQEAIQKTDQYQWYVGASGNGDEDLWEQYSGQASDGTLSSVTNAFKFAMARMSYNLKNQIKEWMSEVLQVLFQAAALCINTIRTFNLVILAILGPLAFGFAVFDGFNHTLTHWLARYVNIFLWLPVANILGALLGNIQAAMLEADLQQIAARGDTFFSATDIGYLIFMIIGIVGFLTVPTIAGYVIQVGGHGAHLSKTSNMAGGAVMGAASAGGQIAGGAMGRAGRGLANILDAPGDIADGYNQGGQAGTWWGKAGEQAGKASAYIKDKIRGNQ